MYLLDHLCYLIQTEMNFTLYKWHREHRGIHQGPKRPAQNTKLPKKHPVWTTQLSADCHVNYGRYEHHVIQD